MASPNSTFTEIVTTTLRNHPDEVADNVSHHNALYRRLKQRGLTETLDGGYAIVRPLDYAANTTYQRYSGYDTLAIQASDVLSAASYNWQQVAVHVAASGLELRQNAGKEQIIKLSLARVKNAMRTFGNSMSTDIYSDGTLSNQVNGLQIIVSDGAGSTVGGINSTTFTFWERTLQSAAAPIQGGGAITVSKTTMRSLMNPLWLNLVRGTDKPDLIVADNIYFSYYEEGLQDNQRYVEDSPKDVSVGFQALKYKTADVIFDGGANGACPASHMYFLNTTYLAMVAHKDANLTQLDEKRSVNQDAVVIPIIWMGNLVCSNRSLQGVMKA